MLEDNPQSRRILVGFVGIAGGQLLNGMVEIVQI